MFNAIKLEDVFYRKEADYYHAGIIEKGLGNNKNAIDFFQTALKLNSSFDILQVEVAKAALRELK